MNCPYCGYGPLPKNSTTCPTCKHDLTTPGRAEAGIHAEINIERMEDGQASAVQIQRAEGPLTIYADSVQIPGVTRPRPVNIPELLRRGLSLEPGGWTRLLGPFGGTISALAVDPFDPKRVYAGMRHKGWYVGLYRSRDGGLSWERLSPGPEDPHIHALGISPHSGALYAGTDKGAYVSLDGGETWQIEHERYQGKEIRCIAFSAQDPYFRYLGSGKYFSGTYMAASASAASESDRSEALQVIETDDPSAGDAHYTLDGGQTWKTMAGIQNVNAAAVPDADGTLLYQGTSDDGLYRRENRLDQNFKLQGAEHVYGLAVSPADPLHVLVGSEAGILQSYDGGLGWEKVEAAGGGQAPAIVFAGEDGQRIFAGGAQGVVESRDGGRTWAAANRGLVHQRVLSLARGSDGSLYAGTDGGGVYRRGARQVSWMESSLGLSDRIQGFSLLVFSDQRLLLGTNSGLYLSENGGLTWKATTNFNLWPVTALAAPGQPPPPASQAASGGHVTHDGGLTWQDESPLPVPDLLLAATSSPYSNEACIYASRDGGYTWEQRNAEVKGRIWSLAISPRSVRWAYAAAQWGGLLSSFDGGLSWQLAEALAGKGVAVVAISSQALERVYVGTGREGVFASDDHGKTWQPLGSGLPDAPVLALACSAHDPALLLAGTQGQGVYRSPDGGQSWSSSGLPERRVQGLAAASNTPGLFLAGTDQGAFLSLDGGESWNAYSRNLEEEGMSIQRLAFSPEQPRLVYAGCFVGVYKSLLPLQ